ncbi:CsbD family protein [Nocardia callitridis]|uniref:CsbD-like domain-containing protein n=1 Tax=Nocardia callitridis TaxID=648753 RepID=A0ABP9KJA9_9NOCA
MSTGDKISNKIDDFSGKAKEAAGKATGDDDLRTEGKTDQAGAAASDAVEKIKGAVGDAVDKTKDALRSAGNDESAKNS